MNKLFLSLLLLMGSMNFLWAQSADLVPFRNGAISFPENIDQLIAANVLPVVEAVQGKQYYWVKLAQIPSDAQKRQLEAAGITLYQYLSGKVYLASFPAQSTPTGMDHLGIQGIKPIEATEKMDMFLYHSQFPPHAVKGDYLSLTLQYIPGVSETALAQKLRAVGVQIDQFAAEYELVFCQVPLSRVYELAAWPELIYLEVEPEPGQPEDNRATSLHRANAINSSYPGLRNYDGSGVRLQIRDDGGIGPHIDFSGRLNQNYLIFFDAITGGVQHADNVGGSAASANNLDPTRQGGATGAEIYVTNYVSNFNDVTLDLHREANVMVTNSSYSDGCNSGYTTRARTLDIQLYENPNLLHVFSSGNDGTSNCGYTSTAGWGNITGGHKTSKNSLTVGATNVFGNLVGFSSRGPTADGRIKPEIVGMGAGIWATEPINSYTNTQGTSFSAPAVAGVATQLYHAYRELNQGENPDAALIKAVIMNGANDMDNPGPDYRTGFGLINALRSVQMLEDRNYLTASSNQGQINTHDIQIPANVKEARIMLYWSDPPALAGSQSPLVNDLNLLVDDNQGKVTQPLVLDPSPVVSSLNQTATPGNDFINNVEQVRIIDPPQGTYTVAVEGFSVPEGPQKYYVVYSFLYNDIKITYPIGGETLVPGETEVVRWDAYGTDAPFGNFLLEYSLNGGLTWNTALSGIPPGARSYNWTVPQGFTGRGRLRLSRGLEADTTAGAFTIMPVPQNLIITQICTDKTQINWSPATNATGYNIYLLGEKYMEVVGRTDANLTQYELPGQDVNQEYWIAVSALSPDSTEGRRTLAINRPTGLLNCQYGLDVSPTAIVSPVNSVFPACMPISRGVSINFTNLGLVTVTDIPVFYQIDNGPIASDTIEGAFTTNVTQSHSFPILFSLDSAGSYELKVWLELGGDQAPGNDTIRKKLEVIATTSVGLPYQEDFESMPLCGTSTACEAVSCILENGWQNLSNGLADDIDWRVHSGATPTSLTGPQQDHKPGSSFGQYIYLEGSGDCLNREGVVWTPCLDLTEAQQPEISFWYHRFGQDIGPLSLDIFANGQWTRDRVFLATQPMDSWRQVKLNLAPYAGQTILIQFRGRTGTDFTTDIALDDIAVYDRLAKPVSDFLASKEKVCVGAPLSLTDLSLNLPTGWKWTFEPNTVTFLNGTNELSQNPTVAFNGIATYSISLASTNSGGTDTLRRLAYVEAVEGTLAGWEEDFEAPAFPPVGWTNENPDGQVAWKRSAVIGSEGLPTQAAHLSNREYEQAGDQDRLLSLITDLSTAELPQLAYDWAYAGRGAGRIDQFFIQVSTDCGETFGQTIYQANSALLATMTDESDVWFPQTDSQWRRDTLDLSAFTGQQVQIRFVNQTGTGNSLFLDNIQVFEAGTAGPNASMRISPTADCLNRPIVFEDASSGAGIITYAWDFGADASPATATGPGPHTVSFASSGGKLVSLTVADSNGTHTSTHALSVQPAPSASFTTDIAGGLVGFHNQTINAESYLWDFGDGSPLSTEWEPAHTYQANASYTVTLIAGNACGADTFRYSLEMQTVSLDPGLTQFRLQLFPNPNQGFFDLYMDQGTAQTYRIVISDLSGRTIQRHSLLSSGASFRHSFDLTDQPPGLYLLQVAAGGQTQVLKVLVE